MALGLGSATSGDNHSPESRELSSLCHIHGCQQDGSRALLVACLYALSAGGVTHAHWHWQLSRAAPADYRPQVLGVLEDFYEPLWHRAYLQ